VISRRGETRGRKIKIKDPYYSLKKKRGRKGTKGLATMDNTEVGAARMEPAPKGGQREYR